ncbi:MAG: hypothetical protein ACREA9_22305, partial [Pyrinomonadaceae bacterium]
MKNQVSLHTRSPGIRPLLVVFVLLGVSLATVAFAQSGRNQGKAPKATHTKTKSSGTTPEPTKSVTPSRSETESTSPQSRSRDSRKDNSTDEVDDADTIRVVSNLVPIPASVVDAKGFAVTGLKLDDFELRVDGQLKTISDMTRSETNVRLAMLFDNSGSLDFAREFEKQAARHFFRQVMRPSDEAAIYSVETESYLAQPLT